jgi:hypothetical protein
MIGPPKARFSPKMNPKLGNVNWPGIRPFPCGVIAAINAVVPIVSGVAGGSI